jgi:hypothetical protein
LKEHEKAHSSSVKRALCLFVSLALFPLLQLEQFRQNKTGAKAPAAGKGQKPGFSFGLGRRAPVADTAAEQIADEASEAANVPADPAANTSIQNEVEGLATSRSEKGLVVDSEQEEDIFEVSDTLYRGRVLPTDGAARPPGLCDLNSSAICQLHQGSQC